MTAMAGKAPAPAERRRRDWAPAGMVGVAMVATGSVLALLAVVFWLSFVEGTPGDPALAYTLDHYRAMFFDSFTYRVQWNTVLFSAMALSVALALAIPVAWLIERTDFPGKPLILTLMTTALLIPGFAVSLGWVFLLHPKIGLVNHWLMAVFGLSEAPLDVGNIFAMGAIEGMNLTPLAFIMTAAALRAMDPALEEAAAARGRGRRCGALPFPCCGRRCWPPRYMSRPSASPLSTCRRSSVCPVAFSPSRLMCSGCSPRRKARPNMAASRASASS